MSALPILVGSQPETSKWAVENSRQVGHYYWPPRKRGPVGYFGVEHYKYTRKTTWINT